MGCGNSKLNHEGEMIPPRIRPLLLRSKFMELRKRKNGTNLRDGTLSKKVLLKDGESEEENSMLVDNRKSVCCSHEGSTNCLDKDEHDSASPIPLSNKATKDGEQSNHLLEEEPLPNVQLKTIHLDETPDLEMKQDKTMDEHKCIQQGDENKKEGEEGRPDSEENRGFICPGSPSFRVYFVEETQDDKGNVEMKDAGMEDVSHKKSPSHDSVESSSTASAKSAEGQENKVMKKGKKGTTFNRVISKKRPLGVGVKNLLNVKSCYHLSCSRNDRANLLARKAEA